MPSTIIVNYLTTQHKASNGFTMAFPDVCKTPAPPAPSPVPIPYPNVGNSMMASKGVSKRVKNNRQKVMVKSAKYSMTNGDNAGIAGGIISSKFMGTAAILNQSFSTKYEKKGVGRLTDPHGVNGGSKWNIAAPAEGQPPNAQIDLARQEEACNALTGDKFYREDGEIKEKPRTRIGNPVDDKDLDWVAVTHGVPPDHARRMQAYAKTSGNSFSLREGNPDCIDRMMSGFEGKPMSCTGDSISNDKGLPGNCVGLVGQKNKDGSWAGIYTSYTNKNTEEGKHLWTKEKMDKYYNDLPLEGRDERWQEVLREKGAYTGDYDMHDMFDNSGGRTKDKGDVEGEINKGLNEIMGVDDKPLCQHGPQNNFGVYLEKNPCDGVKKRLAWGDTKFKRVCRPDTYADPVRPIMHFDKNGNVYILDSPEDMKNLYDCKGADWPAHWPTPEDFDKEKAGDKSYKDTFPDDIDKKARQRLNELKGKKPRTKDIKEKIESCEYAFAAKKKLGGYKPYPQKLP